MPANKTRRTLTPTERADPTAPDPFVFVFEFEFEFEVGEGEGERTVPVAGRGLEEGLVVPENKTVAGP
jgi:hypothetical protein